jgi:hypothetical protein
MTERISTTRNTKGRVVSVRKGRDWAAPHEGEVDVYISRRCTQGGHDYRVDSPWHNPYPVEVYGLKESLRLYEEDARSSRWHRDHLHELEGKTLGCWCAGDPRKHKDRPDVLTAEGPSTATGR